MTKQDSTHQTDSESDDEEVKSSKSVKGCSCGRKGKMKNIRHPFLMITVAMLQSVHVSQSKLHLQRMSKSLWKN